MPRWKLLDRALRTRRHGDGGTVYYVCGAEWYVRAYSDGEVVYTMVPPPTGQ